MQYKTVAVHAMENFQLLQNIVFVSKEHQIKKITINPKLFTKTN
jgi:hypothetical protein